MQPDITPRRRGPRSSSVARKTSDAAEPVARERRSGGKCEREFHPRSRIGDSESELAAVAAVRIPGAERRAVRGRGVPLFPRECEMQPDITPRRRGPRSSSVARKTSDAAEPVARERRSGGKCERGFTPVHGLAIQNPNWLLWQQFGFPARSAGRFGGGVSRSSHESARCNLTSHPAPEPPGAEGGTRTPTG